MLPCVPHLINIAQLGKEEREGFGGQVKLCLPRKARSLARSQLSEAVPSGELSAGGAGPAAFFHRKPSGGGSAEKQKYFRARRRQAVGEEWGTVSLL